jgi:glutamate-ammonia-ligase adenylyltransferase
LSLDDFTRYFDAAGPAAIWERQALVKARVVVGGPAAAARAMRIVHAAAYERQWTAAEVAEIRQMRHRMEEGARVTNLKRGPGGVVDIEFVAQMLQLVHGGAEPALRTPETLPALERLQEAGHLSRDEFAFLEQAYRQLRTIEGHLRLLDASARHDFPSLPAEQRTLAHLLGYDGPEGLVAEVQSLTFRTRQSFDAVFDRVEAGLG